MPCWRGSTGRQVNVYGVSVGYMLAVILRLGGGESIISLDPFIYYPNYIAAEKRQLFPFKTLAMLCNFAATILISELTHYLFMSGTLSLRWDCWKCFSEGKGDDDISIELEGSAVKEAMSSDAEGGDRAVTSEKKEDPDSVQLGEI